MGPPEAAEGDESEEPGEQPLPPIPDALLAPLLDAAGEALRSLRPVDLPPAARRLRSFDRRGLATPVARQQLRKLLEEEEGVLAATVALFRARPEVTRLAEAWDEAIGAGGDAPFKLVTQAAEEGRLPLLASTLVSGLPDCFEFGLGLVVAIAAVGGREAVAADAVRAAIAGQEVAEEARRRAEAARDVAQAEVARLDKALRDERQTRRDREQDAADATAGSAARRAELEAALAEALRQQADAEQRFAEAAVRIAAADRRVAEADHRAAEAERRAVDAAAAATGEADRAVLDQIARAAEDLAAGVRRLADGDPATVPPQPSGRPKPQPAPARSAGNRPSTSPRRRAPVRVPPGMLQDDPAAIEAMVRTRGLAVIVDGYNVSMLAWPGTTAAEQRERLCDALSEFQLRFRCEVTVVFDGAEVSGVRPLRRRNLRVVFSAAGQEADEVVVGEVMFRPDDVPVIVVSSDREVRAGAEAEGATVLGADVFLQLMRR
jgi:predicted RNA-binding protein with PIN domain